MSTSGGKRALGRIRLSRYTDESTSVERQRELISDYCASQGHTIVGWAVDVDFSRSATPFEAPHFGPWLTDEEKLDSWDLIVAWRVDRLGAGWKLHPLVSFLLERGKDLVCVTQPFNLQSPYGRMAFTMFAETAQTEWDAIQERAKGSQAHLRQQGRWRGGMPPYWLTPVRAGSGWRLALDPHTAEVTRGIIADYLAGRPVESICARLNEAGELSPTDYRRARKAAAEAARGADTPSPVSLPQEREKARQRGSQGAGMGTPEPASASRGPTPWRNGSIMSILRNEALMGYQVHQGRAVRDSEGVPVLAGDALLTPGEFAAVQAEIARRRAEVPPRREAGAAPLLGVVHCADCGRRLHLNVQKGQLSGGRVKDYRYYRFPCRHYGKVSADLLEELTYTAFLGVIGDREVHEKRFIPSEDHTAELAQAEAAYEDLLSRLEHAPTEGIRRSLSARLNSLEGRISALAALPRTPARSEWVATGRTYADVWQQRSHGSQNRDLLLSTGVTVSVAKKAGEDPSLAMGFPEDFLARLGLTPDDGGYHPAVAALIPADQWDRDQE